MNDYDLHSLAMLRTPLLPLHQLFELLRTEDKTTELKKIWQNPLVKEAFFLASPNFYQQLTKWENGDLKADRAEKLQLTFLRYFSRMTTRSTPFGLFAGYTLINWKKTTDIVLQKPSATKRSTHVNFQHLYHLKTLLLKDAAVLRQVTFIPNTTFYKFGNQYRFLILSPKENTYQLSVFSVTQSEHLNEILAHCQQPISFNQLLDFLLAKDYEQEEASNFLELLIQNKILVSELEPSTLGVDYLKSLHQKLIALDPQNFQTSTQNIIQHIDHLQQQLDHFDQQNIGLAIEQYQHLLSQIEAIDKTINRKTIFRVNIKKEKVTGQLSYQTAASIRRGIRVLNKLRPPLIEDNISRFAQRFAARYDQEEVPLLEVFDADIGLDYLNDRQIKDQSPLIDAFPNIQTFSNRQQYQWNETQRFLLKKLLEAKSKAAYEIELGEEELKSFSEDWQRFPDSIIANGSILTEAIGEKKGEKIFLKMAGGPSAINVFSRYSLYDEELANQLKDIARLEAAIRPAGILAEVDHLPQFIEGGNVLQRTDLRNFEIPFMTVSHKPDTLQIGLDDILISCQNGQIILRSKKRNKRIFPKISSTFNFAIDPHPIFQFIGDLQNQGQLGGLTFTWGKIHQAHQFLPRVNYQNLILSRATWFFEAEDLRALWSNGSVDQEQLKRWRKQWKIPRYILLQERGDNELFVDLEDAHFLSIFKDWSQSSTKIILKEFLWDEKNAAVKDIEDASYANEFLVCFVHKKEKTSALAKSLSPRQKPIKRTFSIGSEWLYYKWYTGTKTAELLLQKCVMPLCQELLEKKLIDQWFFIRYYDPDYHLRLRFHLPDPKQLGTILAIINSKTQDFLANRWIWNTQIELYQRELERYGENTMTLSESLFFGDSHTVLMLLHAFEQFPNSEALRWQCAFKLIDEYFRYFQYNLEEKINLADKMRVKGGAKNFSEVLKNRFRKEKDLLQQLIEGYPNTPAWKTIAPILEARNQMLQPIAQAIKKRAAKQEEKTSTDMLLRSYIHMTINRLCKVNPNKHEYILYEFIYKCYRSKQVRDKRLAPKILKNSL